MGILIYKRRIPKAKNGISLEKEFERTHSTIKDKKTTKKKVPEVTTSTQYIPQTTSHQDSVRHQIGKTLDYEKLRGAGDGSGLANYGLNNLNYIPTKQQGIDHVMNTIYPDVNGGSAIEKGEKIDFRFNTGRDPRIYAYSEMMREETGKPWADRNKYVAGMWTGGYNANGDKEYDGTWHDDALKNEFEALYNKKIKSLPENTRRQFINKGRDWYYQNINVKPDGSPSDAYKNTWYGRIWNTNDYSPFDANNRKFTPKKSSGGILYKI